MPLSDHEQRMLDQIESALYAEDPKFASSVRGGNLRAPSARRRLQGAALFVIGLAMLVSGIAFKATWIGGLPDSVRGRLHHHVRRRGLRHHRAAGGRRQRSPRLRLRWTAAEEVQGFRRFVHEPDGRPVPPPLRRVIVANGPGVAPSGSCPFFWRLPWRTPVVGATRRNPAAWGGRQVTRPTAPHFPD